MSIYSLLLIIHIAAGIICLLTGVCTIFVRKQKGLHSILGEIYHIDYVFVFLTSVMMSILKWSELQYLFYIALFSYGQALYGYLARKLRWTDWLSKHIIGMLGSYIGIITAVLVVNGGAVTALTGIPKLSLWFIPTVIGSPLIFLATRRFRRFPRKA